MLSLPVFFYRDLILFSAQSFLNYISLCAVYITMLVCDANCDGLLSILKQRGFKYAILAIIDVEANYLIVKAYHYTTITSVQVTSCSKALH